ncbi:coiled-coil domain-containing protein 96 [Nannospalax galili]|uniref:coiled-coil domain-containing protein 96 n=1 Tax=Nannospalax galili TaxID=1026970 RepID=UPI0004ED5A7F|nr:coiled-coil domain-containing protein 96 [Nannospalax galili]
MDSHDGDTQGEGGAEEGRSRELSEATVDYKRHIPANAAEPEPEADAEPSDRGDYRHVEPLEAATETSGDARPGEPEPESESDYETEEGPYGWEKSEDKARKAKSKESRFRPALPLTTIVEEGVAPVQQAWKERAKRESEDRAREGGQEAGERHEKSREEHPQDREEDDESDDDYEWPLEVQKLQEQQLRGELVDQYHALLVERNRYQRYNLYLQQKICEALRKKGLEAAEARDKGVEPESPDKERAYLRYLAMLEELKKQEADDLEWYRQEVHELKRLCQERRAMVEKEWRRFQALKKQVVMQVMGSCRLRGGRQAALREVEQIQALEDKKEEEMSAVRLENVQLRRSLVHFETRMKAQQDLAEGLLLIDFEQLKIENQIFNEKVEERNEELLKLRNKVTNNVQTITHVKEKLHFVDMENSCKRAQLLEVDAQVALGRDILTKTKQARDSLQIDNIKLSQKCGLLGKESLLRDLEEKVEKTELLSRRLESLKHHHAGLTLSCKGVKQKIGEAKAFLPS